MNGWKGWLNAPNWDPLGPREGGYRDKEAVGGMLGLSIPFGMLYCGSTIFFTCWGGRTRHRIPADESLIASPASSPFGF